MVVYKIKNTDSMLMVSHEAKDAIIIATKQAREFIEHVKPYIPVVEVSADIDGQVWKLYKCAYFFYKNPKAYSNKSIMSTPNTYLWLTEISNKVGVALQ